MPLTPATQNTRPNTGAIAVMARGAAITTSGTTAYKAIPNTYQGTPPNRIRLAATHACYARLGLPAEAVVVDSAPGTDYLIGDPITLSGGTFGVPMALEVATSKLISCAGNALGSGYDVADVITLAGGTAATKATITLATLQLATATLNAAGTGYSSGNVITTASAGSTASTHATLNVDTVKLISTAVNAHGSGYAAGGVLTMVGGTGTGATQTVATMDLAAAPTVSGFGTGYVPADQVTLDITGSTASVKTVVTVATTRVVGTPTIFAAGAGGDLVAGAGTIVEGTTGTGTKFQASVTIGAASDIVSVESVTIAGAYTVNPTDITQEPVVYVSGNAGTTLTGAVLGVTMGMATVTLTTPGTYTIGGTGATVFSTTSVAGAGGAFTGCSFGVKTVTLTTGGAYTGTNPTTFTSTCAAGSGATFNTTVFGVGTFSPVNRGSYTVKGTNLSQNGATTPAGGTGFTASTPLWGPKTWTYSNAGDYSATVTALTQDSVAPAGGTGATFQTASYGVLTATVTDPGDYTIDPTNPVSSTSTGAGTGATFTATMITAAAAGDMLIQPGDAVVMDAIGFDHVAAIQVTAGGILSVTPIEN